MTQLYNRQKTILALLRGLNKPVKKTDFQKLLFIFCNEYQRQPSYEFIPYKFGCFSFHSYKDKSKLTELGFLEESELWELSEKNKNYEHSLEKSDQKSLQIFLDEFSSYKSSELIYYTYKNHPYYAIRSTILSDVLNQSEQVFVEAEKPNQTKQCFFTIGYEGKSLEQYLNQLIKSNIHVLCDVRKNAFSRKYGFSKTRMQDALTKVGIKYIHIPELGIISEKRQSLKTQDDYDQLFDEYEKSTLTKETEALNKLYKIFRDHKRVAITCFEAEPCECHRSRIAKALSNLPEWQHPIEHL